MITYRLPHIGIIALSERSIKPLVLISYSSEKMLFGIKDSMSAYAAYHVLA